MTTFDVALTARKGHEDYQIYGWARRAVVSMPEVNHYGYTGSTDGSYAKANKAFVRELMRRAKAAVGLTGVRGVTDYVGETLEFRPYRSCTVMFVTLGE